MPEIHVDRHPGTEVTEVVVEPAPRFVGDDLIVHGLLWGQPEVGPYPVAQGAGQRLNGGLQPLRRDLVAGSVGGQSVSQWLVARQQSADLGMRLVVELG